MIDPSMNSSVEYQELIKILTNWINDELGYVPKLSSFGGLIVFQLTTYRSLFIPSNFRDERIVVRKLDEDLFDGQILGKLVEHLRYTSLCS